MRTLSSILLLSGTLCLSFVKVSAQNPLLLPPAITGTTFNLNLQTGTHQFLTGITTQTMGANGNVLGPTLIVNKGDAVTMNVTNSLADTSTIHWHGLHVAPEDDGGPHTTIPPGTTWSPSFTIMDRAATYWYHPHLHHKTNKHVSKGIAGFILVKDNAEAALTLPRTYGVDDFPLAVQTKDLDATNEIVWETNSDDVLMVNATVNPFLQVPAQVVRLRLLNGSSQRVFNFGLTGNMTFHQIASDGGLLYAPFPLTRLLLSPGERAEILVNLSGMNGQTIYLRSFASEMPNGMYGSTNPGMGAGMQMTGYNPNPLNGTDFNILKLDVIAPTANAVTSIPAGLVTVTPIPANQSNTNRTLTFMPAQMGPNQLNGEFMINNAMFDMNVINYTIPLNNTEIWTLNNNSAISHPFHIHDVQFYILDRNGAAPPLNEQGRKDVVLVRPQETVRFIATFDDFSNDMVPYVYHCHMLRHEDGGMMGQFLVVNPNGVAEQDLSSGLTLYPNPGRRQLNIRSEMHPVYSYQWYNATGAWMGGQSGLQAMECSIDLQGKAKGLYFIRIQTERGLHTEKFVIE